MSHQRFLKYLLHIEIILGVCWLNSVVKLIGLISVYFLNVASRKLTTMRVPRGVALLDSTDLHRPLLTSEVVT